MHDVQRNKENDSSFSSETRLDGRPWRPSKLLGGAGGGGQLA